MFRCQMCSKVAGAGIKAMRVTVVSRPKEYRGTVEEFPRRRFGRFRETRKPRDRGGKGHEIVKELMVCASCGAAHKEKQAAIEAAAVAAAEAAEAVVETAEAVTESAAEASAVADE
ncbi:MAG: hypothetical protein GY878_10020 [Fuerstiella sp.]|nr:hypothetical protein [Fuerstiella sp.]